MKNNQEQIQSDSVILAQDVVRYGGMQLFYSLKVKTGKPVNVFEIAVSKEDESSTAEAGSTLDFAWFTYRSVVENIVTPCTLEDVMRDFEYSHRKLQKNLYKIAFL